jgi:hypothetical protein
MPPTQFDFSKKPPIISQSPTWQHVNPNPQIPTKNFPAKSEIRNRTQRAKQYSELFIAQNRQNIASKSHPIEAHQEINHEKLKSSSNRAIQIKASFFIFHRKGPKIPNVNAKPMALYVKSSKWVFLIQTRSKKINCEIYVQALTC